jgi:hypothetical protein
VNDAQGAIAHPVRFDEVFFYNRADISGRNRVQVEHIRDRNTDGLAIPGLHNTLTKKPGPANGTGHKNYAITVTART